MSQTADVTVYSDTLTTQDFYLCPEATVGRLGNHHGFGQRVAASSDD